MQHRVAALTEQDLADLATQDDTVVYREGHSHVFEPWPMETVEACAMRMYELTHQHRHDAEARKAAIDADAELVRFRTDHALLSEKLSDPSFCNDRRTIKTLVAMFRIRQDMVDGKLTEEEARSKVSAVALRSALPASHPAQTTLAREGGQ